MRLRFLTFHEVEPEGTHFPAGQGHMAVSDVRSHTRIPKNLVADLARTNGTQIKETVLAQNLSAGGARVATQKIWPTGELVVLSTPERGFSVQARVVYCQRLENGNFAVGLELLNAGEGLSKFH